MLAIAIVAKMVLDGLKATLTQNDEHRQQAKTRSKYGNRRKGDAISEVHRMTVTAPADSPLRMTASTMPP